MVVGALSQYVTWNLLFLGLINGLIVAPIAMGIVLVYRSSRVINFAVGDIGVPCAAVLALAAGKHNVPYWPALIAALALGALAGAVIELGIIRRLFRAPRVIVLVATVGVAELAQVITLYLPGYRTGSLQTAFPTPITSEWQPGLGITVRGGHVLVLTVVPLVALGLWWLLGHTTFGENVRAASANADLARLTGVSPKLLSTAIWTLAGLLSAIGVILTATVEASPEIIKIGPQTLLAGMAAALIGRMVSFPRAVVGAVIIGVVRQLLFFNFNGADDAGLTQFVLFAAVLVLVARISRETESSGESFQFAPRVNAVPERLRNVWWVRRLPQAIAITGLVVGIVLPFVMRRPSQHVSFSEILAFALAAVSITVLTGWGGQLSLGQMAFAGIGALTASRLVQGFSIDVGWRDARLSGALRPAPFWLAVLLGAVAACLVAALVGIGALRVRGLMLAISTIAFAIAGTTYIFQRPILGGGGTVAPLPRERIGPLDITNGQRNYYFLVLGVLVVLLVAAGHLRRSGIGRTIIGVRENEQAAAALTVSPTRAKLTAFALGGFVAGLAGALLGGLAQYFSYADNGVWFRVQDSLRLVSIAVIGGLGSLAGAVVGALWVVGLPAFWPNNQVIPLLTSSIGLLIMLLYFPGGLAQIGYFARDALLARVARRLPEQAKAHTAPPAALAVATTRVAATTNSDGSLLATTAVTVHFGGLAAVDGVDFRLAPGEVVGLIGTNGAGKSTLLNAIGGFVASTGSIHLLGHDISGMAPHRRARLGLGRTFQAATLFPELTVRETIELALEARRRSSFWATALFLPPATRLERRRRSEAAELIDYLGLGRYGDRYVAELSTGTRRIVELTAVLAVAPRVLCLDEPTAGVAQREAEAFGPLVKRVQAELGAALVIVEHDLPMILSISDRVYCMEAGRVIAEGPPGTIRDDPKVVASYLGTDERAIQRSGASAV